MTKVQSSARRIDTGLLSAGVARILRDTRSDVVARWLERISARVTVDPNRIFPTEELLNHVPLLIDGIADYLEYPGQWIDTDIPVAAKAMELGALRHAQGFDAYEILKEYEILGGIVDSSVAEAIDELGDVGARSEVSEVWRRVSQAIDLIRQATMTHFLRLSGERVNEREERLRRFNRMVSHELKNRVGAVRGAASLLTEPWLGAADRDRFHQMILENSDALQRVLANLESLSRIDGDARQRKNVLLPQACAEVTRQLRQQSEAAGVMIRLSPDLPPVEIDAAGVELCLGNFVSNAIKYSDRAKAERWVEISGDYRMGTRGGELVIYVRDNGRGVPAAARPRLFEQFYRAHGETVTEVGGTGLGLSIVRETAESLGGRAWAEFPDEGGSVFAFSLPSRRAEDAAAAGTHRPDGGVLG
jgi:signal transduction histidine kinase